MRVKKGDAYVICMIAIVTLSVLAVLAAAPDARAATIAAIFPGAILGVVGVTTSFIAGNVADNGVKGRFYNAALDTQLKEPRVEVSGFSSIGGDQ